MHPVDGSLIHATEVGIHAAATTLGYIPSARFLNGVYTIEYNGQYYSPNGALL